VGVVYPKNPEFTSSFTWNGKNIPFVDERVGMQVKLCWHLTTRAIPERFCDDVRYRDIKCSLPLPLAARIKNGSREKWSKLDRGCAIVPDTR